MDVQVHVRTAESQRFDQLDYGEKEEMRVRMSETVTKWKTPFLCL